MKIYFVNRFYHPDFSATSQMLTGLASSLAGNCKVTVVTSRRLYNDPVARLNRKDEYRGVEILRLNTTRLGRARLWRRAFDYLTFYLGVMWWLARYVKPGDVVVLMTDPPLLQLLNTSIIRIKGGKVVNWLQDIFPEIAQRLGLFPRPAWLSRLIIRWRDEALRAVQVNVVISARMKHYLAGRGVNNTQLIPNWSHGELITPLAHADNSLRQAWGLADKFTVGYSGNFGRAHGFTEIIEAMTLLSPHAEIHFLFIGEGAALEQLKSAIEQKRLTNASFKPYQARDALRCSLGAIDLHLVSLKAGMEDLVLPSKLYGVLAAGRPVAFIGEKDGEIAQMVQANEAGFALGYGDGVRLARQIQLLVADPRRAIQMGQNARRLFDREYAMPLAMERWQQLMLEVIGQ